MIDHIGLDVSDIERSQAFYRPSLAPLGIHILTRITNDAGNPVVMMGEDEVFFVIAQGQQVGTDSHVAFRTDTAEKVDAFHKAALAAGGKDNGGPGVRPQYGDGYYAAFVRDPDGINVEAVCHLPV